MGKTVKITKGELVGECLPSAVKAWEANGWTAVDDGSSDSVPAEEQDQGDQGQYNLFTNHENTEE